MATWLEFSMAVDRESVEPVSALFHRYADGGVTLEEAITPTYEEPGFVRHDDRPVVVRAYIPHDDRAPGRRRQVEEAVWHLNQLWPVGELLVREVDEEDWANAWKAHYPVFRLGRRTVIKPVWLDYDAAPGDVVLELDPGLAFGTGQHPTTAHCLELLEEYVTPGCMLLDVGTGSGILSIAALKLGATEAVMLDVDPVAVRSAGENLAHNGLTRRAKLATGSLPNPLAPPGSFDLVTANIIASVLVELAGELAAVLRPGGALLASGIIASRESEVLAAFDQAGFRVEQDRSEGDWRSFALRRA